MQHGERERETRGKFFGNVVTKEDVVILHLKTFSMQNIPVDSEGQLGNSLLDCQLSQTIDR